MVSSGTFALGLIDTTTWNHPHTHTGVHVNDEPKYIRSWGERETTGIDFLMTNLNIGFSCLLKSVFDSYWSMTW